MKRIFIIGRYISTYGGAHKYLELLSKALINKGVEVLIGLERHTTIEKFCLRLEKAGANIAQIPFDSSNADCAAKVLDAVITDFRPFLIDCQVSAQTVRKAVHKSRKMHQNSACKIFTMHGPIISETPRMGRLYPFRHLHGNLREKREFLRIFDEAVSVSQLQAERICKLLDLPDDFFTYIPNGVDTTVFSPALENSSRHSTGVLTIGGCGSLVKLKRFDLLLMGVDRLLERGVNVRALICGQGPEYDSLSSMISEKSLGRYVSLLGHQSDVASFMRKLDVFVMCSDREGSPYALLEAMASGLPSVVTKVGELPYIVRDAIEGYVIPPSDHRMLAEKLQVFIERDSDRRDMGRRARQRVVKNYDERHQIQKVVDKFLELMN